MQTKNRILNRSRLKTVLILCLAISLAGFQTPALSQLDAPTLASSLDGIDLSLSWSQVDGGDGYTLFYAPYPTASPVYDADMGSSTSFSAMLWDGAAFYIAVKAYNNAEESPFSNVEYFIAGEGTQISLQGDAATVSGAGATVENSTVTITSPGTFLLQGTLNDGQIIVDAGDENDVVLMLNGIDITNATNAPLFVKTSNRTTLVLGDNCVNTLTDGSGYTYDDPDEDEPDAALFSKSDLVISGNGTLNVNANYNDAVKSKDGLQITGGSIEIISTDDGIVGKDYISVQDGNITVTAQGDGLKSTNDEDQAKGYITVDGGTFTIVSGADALQAETDISVTGGNFTLTAGGGSSASIGADDSAKGVKAGGDIAVSGGTFTINSADDAVHANGNIEIATASFSMATGDDGIHADADVTINSGSSINITESYEGIEGATITVNGGEIRTVSSDDGINVAGGTNATSQFSPPFGKDPFITSDNYYLCINDGTIIVDADGDGLDANGTIEMNGGVVIINGPTNNGNGALDYDGSFTMAGGFLAAAGSAGMAQAPSFGSSQNSLLINFPSSLAADTLVHIQNSGGEGLLTFAPSKTFQSLVFSSPDLISGSTYTVFYGGSATGTVADGLYENAVYTPGTQYKTVTVSGTITQVNQK